MHNNQFITLTSDWRNRDPYLAIYKSKILQAIPSATLFDLTHTLPLGQHEQAAFLVKASLPHFQEKTIHFILIEDSLSRTAKPYLFIYKGHYIIAEQTKAFYLMKELYDEFQCYQYVGEEDSMVSSKMIQIAQWVKEGSYQKRMVEATINLAIRKIATAEINEDQTQIIGKIIYIDAYANAITNIPDEMFSSFKNGSFTAECGCIKQLKIRIYQNYRENTTGEVYLTTNLLNFIEITYYKGNIAFLSNLKVGDHITITKNL